MTEITHQPCPFMSCASSDAFSWNPDKGTGRCHSCGEGYPSRERTFDWAKQQYKVGEFMKEGLSTMSYTPKMIESPAAGQQRLG